MGTACPADMVKLLRTSLLTTGMGLAVLAACGPGSASQSSSSGLRSGTGLTGEYYLGVAFDSLQTRQVDPQVNFDWGMQAPMAGMPADLFSVRWTGQIEAPVAGVYTFTTTSDDGVRLWVDGKPLVDNWTQHAAMDDSGGIPLQAGQRYDVKLEFYENTGRAVAKLSWAYPGQSKAVVPSVRLYQGGPSPTGRGISVSGNQLTRNGQPWMPKGLSMIGALTKGSAVTAYAHWGIAELQAAKQFGADALRLQVSQPFLDPQSSQYSPAYLTRLKAMVDLAQSQGFALILSMQDQSLAGGNADALPTQATLRAWQALGPVYATNGDIIYELFNEPQNSPDSAGWAAWKNGSAGTVGHQELVTALRGLGAQNVILADGALHAEVLSGVPMLSDPAGKLGYAAHPYYLGSIKSDPAAWDKRFGNISNSVPVVVTEWDAYSASPFCDAAAPTLVPQFFAYAKQHHIGIFGWSYDLPGTLVKDWSWSPSSLSNFTCGNPEQGAGALLSASFQSR